MARKTNEQFLQEMKVKAPNIIPLEKYMRSKDPILCECRKCGHKWPAIPNNLLRGEGCPHCAKNTKKTTQQFIEELKVKNPTVVITGEYKSNKIKIKYKCKKCGLEDEAVPSSLLKGHGCRRCADKNKGKNRKHSNEWFLSELQKENPGIEPLETYKTFNEKIQCRCVCGNIWKVSPANLLQGKRCRKCMGKRAAERQTWTNEEFVMKLHSINPRIEPLEDYKGINESIECRCMVCGKTWPAKPHQLLMGRGCRSCQRRWQTSFPEQAIFYYIRKAFPEAENSYKEGFYPSELDIFIPTINVGIEYDGWAHHNRITETEIKKYDLCKEKEISLIRVRERTENIDTDLICDLIIHSDYGDTKKYASLDDCISKVCNYLNISIDIDVERDAPKIREQFFTEYAKGKSFGENYPQLAMEWDSEKNGAITPYMVSSKSGTEYHWICPKCGRSYPASPATRAAGHGCSACAGTIRKTHEQFIAEMSEKAPEIIVLGKYSNANTDVKIKCRECGKEDYVTPHELLSGRRCRFCSKKNADFEKTLPEDEFLQRVRENSPGVEVIGKYVNSHTRIQCRCKKCGHTWSPIANTLYLGNTGCAKCAGNKPLRIMCVETGEIFQSMYQAEKKMNVNHSSLYKCIHGKGETAGGHHWRILEDRENG